MERNWNGTYGSQSNSRLSSPGSHRPQFIWANTLEWISVDKKSEVRNLLDTVRHEAGSPLANGFVRSFERSYAGLNQLIIHERPVARLSEEPGNSSTIAQTADTIGEAAGTGLQLLLLNRMMRSGAGGAVYGAVFLPSAGENIAMERVKGALKMGGFMMGFELGRLGSCIVGLSKPMVTHSLARGSLSGALGGVAHDTISFAVDDNSRFRTSQDRVKDFAISAGKGATTGIAMELGGSALTRLNHLRSNRHQAAVHD